MHLAKTELWEGLFQHLIAIFQILQVALLTFFDEWKHDVHLSSFTNLLTDTIIEGGHARVEHMSGANRFATRWQFVDDTHVEIAIKCHGECARDGCCCHHQNVGRIDAFTPKFGSLGHTKAMLLVDHDKPQTSKLHGIFDYRMGTYKDMDGAIKQTFKNFLTTFAFYDTSKQGYTDVHIFQKTHDGLQVLFCEDFRGCHDAGLIPIVDGNQHRHERYQCLARAHIALQQTVHLSPTTHVLAYLSDHPFLGTCQWKRQVVVIECIKDLAHLREYVASIFASLVAGISHDIELYEKKFLELESYPGAL